MDLVLGLSITSAAVRWVRVEGTTGEGATIDRGAFDLSAPIDPEDLLDVLLVDEDGTRIHAAGVTWTNGAERAATGVLEALTARGVGNVIAVSELEAGEVLAAGLASITEHDDIAVCIVEPDAAVVASVHADGIAVDRIARPLDGADAVELPSSVIALMALNQWEPEAVFVLGSAADLDLVASTLGDVTDAPVITSADADLALPRGAALASARAVTTIETTGPRLRSKVGAAAAVLAAAVVTFVVSVSVALGLQMTSDADHQPPQAANAVDEPAAVAAAPATPQSVPQAISPAQARPVVAQTIVVAAPPPPPPAAVGPVYEPPPAYIPPEPPSAYPPPAPAYPPPAPAYVPPPPPPNYVPPTAPQPRLRDRIIERLPIINRFHEPEYQSPR